MDHFKEGRPSSAATDFRRCAAAGMDFDVMLALLQAGDALEITSATPRSDRFLPCTMLKSVGTKITVAQVAKIRPPITARPSGMFCPGSMAMGSIPIIMAGAVWHAFPELDFYTYAGEEFQNAKAGLSFTGAHTPFGWGNPNFVNSGCQTEFFGTGAGASACTGNTKLIRQITTGFWDNIYKGPFGRLAGGLQYSFTQRFAFAGVGGTPKRDENMFLTSLRYYPF